MAHEDSKIKRDPILRPLSPLGHEDALLKNVKTKIVLVPDLALSLTIRGNVMLKLLCVCFVCFV